ncbi:pectinesterase inhibitor 3-like [Corylus avellana]|uniref:pectinesterase inhibitor 3-like n=1 Tax=Corylus avellana TaxID=13451 RepID=UPI00286AA320|nr:pectinesterase inhibitor 3-like [Corylus avellana]
MNTISCSKVFLVLLVTLLPNQIFADQNLISSACGHTLYKDLCTTTLESDPESSSATSFDVLTKVALKHATSTATEIHDQVTTLLKGSSSNKDALTGCNKNFQDAIERLAAASKSLASKKYFDVYTWVSSAVSSSDTCGEGFKKVGETKSPLADQSTTFAHLGSIVIDITNQLK